MTHFGDHLVKKGLIDQGTLIRALVNQSSQTVAAARLVFEAGDTDAPQMLAMLMQQAETGAPFLAICRQHDLAVDEAGIQQKQQERRQPLGQILADISPLNAGQLREELSAFLGESGETPSADAAPSAGSPAGEGESLNFTFPKISGETQAEYISLLDDPKKSDLEKTINQLETDLGSAPADQNTKDLAQLAEEYLALCSTAKFARLQISEHLLTLTLDLLTLITGKVEEISEEEAACCTKATLRTLDVIWELRTFITISGSEEEFWNNKVSHQNFLTVKGLMDKAKAQLIS